jgi:myo-inositol-1(or 4)-monophosphatase
MFQIPRSQSNRTAAEVAREAALKAGEYVDLHFHDHKDVSEKSRANFVSQLDVNAEKIVLDILKKEYPGWSIVSEESSPDEASKDFTWFIDPVDGTTNSIYEIPFVCINVALVYNNVPVIGITYDPLRKELFMAEAGKGAFLNGKKISVTPTDKLEKALVCCDLGYKLEKGKETLELLNKLWGKIAGSRLLGSAALGLAYVAAGRISLYFHHVTYPWDIAPGILLVREACGEAVDWQNNPAEIKESTIIASNHELVQQFRKLISG